MLIGVQVLREAQDVLEASVYDEHDDGGKSRLYSSQPQRLAETLSLLRVTVAPNLEGRSHHPNNRVQVEVGETGV